MTPAQHFEAFCWYYLTKYIKYPFATFHKEWFELMFSNNRLAMAAPRNFAKSHIASLFYPLFLALEKPGISIMLVSATKALAERFLGTIKAELESNDLLKEDYGDQETEKWSTERLTLKNGSTIQAKGAEAQVRGFRPDVVIVDDIEDDEAVWSEDRRRKLDDWFWRALVNTLNPESQLIVVGTLLHPLSFLSILTNSGRQGWVVKVYTAIKDNESCWPQRWPMASLLKRKDEIGDAAFAQEYMNDPIPDDWRIFKKADLKYYDVLPKGLRYTITIDPAATVKSRSDYTAIVVLGTDIDGVMHLAEYTRKKLLPNEIIEELFRLNAKYNPTTIGIETVGFQSLLKYMFEIECRKRGVYPNVQELALDVSERGRKKRFRIESLQPYIVKGKLLLGQYMEEMEAELLCFPTGKHDDLIDALSSQLEIVAPANKERTPDIPGDTFLGHLLTLKSKTRRSRRIRSWSNRHSGVTW